MGVANTAFDLIDRNRDGAISHDEWARLGAPAPAPRAPGGSVGDLVGAERRREEASQVLAATTANIQGSGQWQ